MTIPKYAVASTTMPKAMRYQANGAKLWVEIEHQRTNPFVDHQQPRGELPQPIEVFGQLARGEVVGNRRKHERDDHHKLHGQR